MYKVQLTWFVHLGKFVFSNELHKDVSEEIGVFERTITLPFYPFIGLQLVDGKWQSPPIETVVFDMEANGFSCGFLEDLHIPNTAREILEARNIDWAPSDVEEYVRLSASNRVKHLIEQGWEHKGTL